MVVFGTSFASAIFPALSEAISKNKPEDFSAQISKFMRIIIFFMVPMIVILIILRMQIIRLLFGSGNFGWEQTIMTADTLAYLSLSLVFTGLTPLFSRGFYALHNTKTPMIITVVGVVISILLGKILSVKMGIGGLALGYTIGSAVSCVAFYLSLRNTVKIPGEKSLVIFIFKVLLSSLLMGLIIQGVKLVAGNMVDMHRAWGVLAQAFLCVSLGISFYGFMAWIFKLDEIQAVSFIWQKLSRKNVAE